MPIPKVAIVGRPNVGKSSIFNWIIGRRVTIVDPTSGVTRDRVTHLIEDAGRYFEITDTGGMGVVDVDGLTADIERQIKCAMEEADLILFVVDAQNGFIPLDEHVIGKLRDTGKRIVCIANKCDNAKLEAQAVGEFNRFGLPLTCISAAGGRNKDALFQTILANLPPADAVPAGDAIMKIAIVGKTNAGKSTFINCLAQSERMIVSEVPGTTRDSVDVRFEHNGKAFIAIDTAGVRRKKHLDDNIAFYSHIRAQQAIRRADVVLLFLDPTSEFSRLDKQLASDVVERQKPCIFVVNKWDLMKEDTKFADFSEHIDYSLPGLAFAPKIYITAKSGRNWQKLIDVAQKLYNQAHEHMSTAELNRVVAAAVHRSSPPSKQAKRAKVFYASQAATAPPTVVVFVNEPALFPDHYRRYLVNELRRSVPFPDVPIRLVLRRRGSAPEGLIEDDSGEGMSQEPIQTET